MPKIRILRKDRTKINSKDEKKIHIVVIDNSLEKLKNTVLNHRKGLLLVVVDKISEQILI